MENLNLVELLRDCPKGMELDCTIFDNTVFVGLSDNVYPIRVTTKDGSKSLNLTQYGCTSENKNAKCVIFPKGKTTWEGFVPPKPKFKCGDVVACDCSDGDSQLFIFKEYNDNNDTVCYLFLDTDETLDIDEFAWKIDRLATEEEKQKLFDAIKANGYKWNAETKTLERLIVPKFKVGDRIKHIVGREEIATVVGVEKLHYNLYSKVGISSFSISLQREWELVPNKFDITTLKPFESRVLVRDYDNQIWIPTFFGKRLEDNSNCSYLTTNGCYKYCIPYEGNEHLLGTTNDCDDFYKTWEK